MIRFCTLISTSCSAMLKLYKAFMLAHFHYCSTVWHFYSFRNCDKLETLNRCTLRIVEQLLETTSLYIQRIQSMLTTIYKCLHLANHPKFLKELLTVRPSIYNLKGINILLLPKPATITYGLHSFKYCVVKLWNSLPDNIRRECTLN